MKQIHKALFAGVVASGLLMGGAGCAVTSGQSSTGQYVDDVTIGTRVKTRFAQDKEVSAMRINVDTLNGMVQLSGFATTEAEKAKAGQIARSVPDVKDVRNNIVVRAATN